MAPDLLATAAVLEPTVTPVPLATPALVPIQDRRAIQATMLRQHHPGIRAMTELQAMLVLPVMPRLTATWPTSLVVLEVTAVPEVTAAALAIQATRAIQVMPVVQATPAPMVPVAQVVLAVMLATQARVATQARLVVPVVAAVVAPPVMVVLLAKSEMVVHNQVGVLTATPVLEVLPTMEDQAPQAMLVVWDQVATQDQAATVLPMVQPDRPAMLAPTAIQALLAMPDRMVQEPAVVARATQDHQAMPDQLAHQVATTPNWCRGTRLL